VRRLTVLLDLRCPPCRRFRQWLAREPAFVPLEVLSHRSPTVAHRYPTLVLAGQDRLDPVVLGDGGEVWRGAHAWRMCLWALKRWRKTSLSERLARETGWEHSHAAAAAVRPPTARTGLTPLSGLSPRPSVGGDALRARGTFVGVTGLLWLLIIPCVILLLGLVATAIGNLSPNVRGVVLAVVAALLLWRLLPRPCAP
jgi:hypothetical protein